jgi:glycolate oxidase FAD binding subunit
MNAAPDRVVPVNAEAVSKIVARCDRAGEKILIAGGGTLAGMGYPPERVDVELVTTGLTGIAANERADLVVAVRAGMPVQDIARLLAAQGQFVPLDAPQPRYATLGGTLAAGWLGPRRLCYGRLRDYLIGSTIVLADGTIAHAGGMVVKNVAGYDMSRLYVGSFGTLGVLVQANLKTIPLPPHARLFLASLPERTRERVLAILEGSAALLERATLELRSALGRAGVPETRVIEAGARESFERVVDQYVACLGERSATYRLFPPAEESVQRALDLRELAQRFGLQSEAIGDVMNGDVVLRVSDLDTLSFGAKIEAFDDALHEAEPRAQVVASSHPHRMYLRVWGADPPAVDRMRQLKERFDPKRTLNPGRFVGGI